MSKLLYPPLTGRYCPAGGGTGVGGAGGAAQLADPTLHHVFPAACQMEGEGGGIRIKAAWYVPACVPISVAAMCDMCKWAGGHTVPSQILLAVYYFFLGPGPVRDTVLFGLTVSTTRTRTSTHSLLHTPTVSMTRTSPHSLARSLTRPLPQPPTHFHALTLTNTHRVDDQDLATLTRSLPHSPSRSPAHSFPLTHSHIHPPCR